MAEPDALELRLASPRGFCAGVDRAIEIVERALDAFGAPIFVRHEVVHNRFVVEDLKSKGAVFVEELAAVPSGATVIFSAHGVSRQVQTEARACGLKIFDATCPLVTKVHSEVARYGREGKTVILIGHAGHPEVEGTMGQARGPVHLVETVGDIARLPLDHQQPLGYVTQTTLSVDDTAEVVAALKARFNQIEGPRHDDICYATQNRQDAVRVIAADCDIIFIVGSANSSNSNRLREQAEKAGAMAYLIDCAADIRLEWLAGCARVGVSAGASAPEVLVQEVADRLEQLGAVVKSELRQVDEGMAFALPTELRVASQCS
ncbi:MAG: 4-hydroxy-3-methylbut-2-enyl diphosphate reductase [Arenicellales bacterium]|jgi:4-hydroxy-3-methylbut-2-enyl diphosphate reductase|nr:4-hydroxy-3-methylbut-2-enyl diphosphate reductase [Arenicellales bacterium]|tara:strand:- start:280 stop:1236 length:957 start_codon:yes stop_codon:yes gene_type:complete